MMKKKPSFLVVFVMLCSLGLLACGALNVVTFDSMGGGSVESKTDIPNGSVIAPPSNPQKVGYVFGGWYKDADITEGNEWIFDADTVTESITLYARWTAETYAVTYFDVGGTAFSGTHGTGQPTTHTYHAETALVNPEKDLWDFKGWFTNQDGSGTSVTNLSATGYTADVILYAKWERPVYTITYRDAGDAVFSGTHGTGAPTKHTYNTATTLINPTKTNWLFVGWFTDSDATTTPVTSLFATGYTANMTLYAKWEQPAYTVTYRDIGGDALSGTPGDQTPVSHTYGTATALVSPEKDFWDFKGWFTNSAGTGTAITSLTATGYTANITLYAKWERPVYTITYRNLGDSPFTGTHGANSPTKHTYGTPTNLVSPTSSYVFEGWFFDSEGAGTAVTALGAEDFIGNITLYARWRQLTFNLIDNGTAYKVAALNTTLSGIIGIPSVYNGLPVTRIAEYAFDNCNGITDARIPSSVTSIGSAAFQLTDVWNKIPLGGLLYIDNWLVTMKGPWMVTEPTQISVRPGTVGIGEWAFNRSALISITLPDSVQYIGQNVFVECRQLTSVTISSSVIKVDSYAFRDCGTLTIYAEPEMRPENWSKDWKASWDSEICAVVWGCTLSADKAYVVSFTKSADSISNPVPENAMYAPIRAGYTFGGWATEEGGVTPVYTAANVNSAPNGVNLYAIWVKNS